MSVPAQRQIGSPSACSSDTSRLSPTLPSSSPTSPSSSTAAQHPTSSRQHPTSLQQHPTSSQQHPTSSQQHPTSSQQHPTSSQQHPTSLQQCITTALGNCIYNQVFRKDGSLKDRSEPKPLPDTAKFREWWSYRNALKPKEDYQHMDLSALRPGRYTYHTVGSERIGIGLFSPKTPTQDWLVYCLPPWPQRDTMSIWYYYQMAHLAHIFNCNVCIPNYLRSEDKEHKHRKSIEHCADTIIQSIRYLQIEQGATPANIRLMGWSVASQVALAAADTLESQPQIPYSQTVILNTPFNHQHNLVRNKLFPIGHAVRFQQKKKKKKSDLTSLKNRYMLSAFYLLSPLEGFVRLCFLTTYLLKNIALRRWEKVQLYAQMLFDALWIETALTCLAIISLLTAPFTPRLHRKMLQLSQHMIRSDYSGSLIHLYADSSLVHGIASALLERTPIANIDPEYCHLDRSDNAKTLKNLNNTRVALFQVQGRSDALTSAGLSSLGHDIQQNPKDFPHVTLFWYTDPRANHNTHPTPNILSERKQTLQEWIRSTNACATETTPK